MNLQPNFSQYQKTSMVLNQEMLQTISLLAYSTHDLLDYIREQAMENPLIECEKCFKEVAAKIEGFDITRAAKKQRQSDEINSIIENVKDQNNTTLSAFLLEQAGLLKLSEKEYKYLAYFINNLDDNGYLTTSMQDISTTLAITLEEGRNYLSLLQNMEPSGIGASNLQECLLLQLKKNYPNDKLAFTIMSEYFDLFAAKKWQKIAKELSISLSDIKLVQMKILELQPRPGLSFQHDLSLYIRPDISVHLVNDYFEIQLKDQLFSKLTVNKDYLPLLQNKKGIEYKYIRKKYAEFQSLSNSLKQREALLVDVCTMLVQMQEEFFYEGPSKLKPLTLKQIADALEIHESTISRIVSNKYVETSFGILSLKSFFSQGIKGENEQEISSTAVKKIITSLIAEEDKQKPYSDEKLKNVLESKYDIYVSRRVITKYREELNIPSSSKRKQF
ncbi:RNA polymerase factor sigma-54 [Niallia sp. 03133]|uniref:RNA polymerase factor sigma-54 n=1 Tax=Niallia sp. 03133 TaxID=3458060 RepID=UPI00404518D5